MEQLSTSVAHPDHPTSYGSFFVVADLGVQLMFTNTTAAVRDDSNTRSQPTGAVVDLFDVLSSPKYNHCRRFYDDDAPRRLTGGTVADLSDPVRVLADEVPGLGGGVAADDQRLAVAPEPVFTGRARRDEVLLYGARTPEDCNQREGSS